MDKRTQILIAAESVLAERGFYAFSMQNLANTAGVAAGTLYRYFDSKEALMNELQKFIREQSANIILAGFSECPTIKEKYNLVWQNIFDCVIANPRRLTLIEILHCIPNVGRENITLFENEAFKPLISFYQQGIDTKQFLNWQLFALIAVSIDTAISLAKQVIRERVTPDQKQLQQVRDASWNIIQNPHFKSTGIIQ
ncbi:TetR/AcrR family transcriptional regulator [uncultured Psychromonas sp.]|uniref:TetR/AcrR family transcriptional regulator n=1 Tax=uncultured Psychromonas sp. TaxID=173974 RepID=UPI0026394D3D|nr:TetR/AcrR family transcriptional regulator [uncultured Psychromonas sp.]